MLNSDIEVGYLITHKQYKKCPLKWQMILLTIPYSLQCSNNVVLNKRKFSKPMRLKTVFINHKQVIVWSHIASKIIMVTSSKPNFLTSKVGKFSLRRNCLSPRLPLLLSFLHLLECTDVKNPKVSESLFLIPNYATLLNFSLSFRVFPVLRRFLLNPILPPLPVLPFSSSSYWPH